jgi:hypothetical protein
MIQKLEANLSIHQSLSEETQIKTMLCSKLDCKNIKESTIYHLTTCGVSIVRERLFNCTWN